MLITFAASLLVLAGDIACAQTAQAESWKNYFGIHYLDTPSNRIKYAKQMGHDYITLRGSSWDSDAVKAAMRAQGVTGLKFYINNPYQTSMLISNYTPAIPDSTTIANSSKAAGGVNIVSGYQYTPAQIQWYNERMAQGTTDAWPKNLAAGWYDELPNTANPQGIFVATWDFQQQAVIDEVISKIIAMMRASEDVDLNFKCAGWSLDVATLNGDFHALINGGQPNTTISHWTGNDSALLYPGRTHDYPTYADGVAAFYKQLKIAIAAKFPGAKWIIDPSRIYAPPSAGIDDWISKIKDRPDKNELIPDLLMEEGASTDFVDQPLNFNTSGLDIKKNMVGSHQRTKVEEERNRIIAAKAGVNGAWYNWFMLFGWPNASAGWTMPYWTHIADVYPRIKLIRHIPNWDNLNGIPLASRTCGECAKITLSGDTSNHDSIVYESTDGAGNIQSHIDKDVMYSRHPGGVVNSANKGKLFAVFISTKGVIKLKPEETVGSVRRDDGYFEEGSTDASGDIHITAAGDHREISLNTSVVKQIDIDTVGAVGPNGAVAGIGQVKGNGYIFTLASTPNPGAVAFSGANYSAAENAGSLAITVSRTGGSSGAASVRYASSDGTATAGADYGAASGTLSWADGDSANKTFTLAITNDTLDEPDETIILNLSNATGASQGTPKSAILTIIDDDAPQSDTGPIASYGFDEGSGTIAKDASGNNYNGAINGAAWTTGKVGGGALSFNGTNSYVALPHLNSAFNEFTAAAWVKVNDLTAVRGIFTTGGMNGSGFRFRINTDGSLWLLMAGGGGFDTLSTAAGVIQSGTFHHISVTGKSGQSMRIYVDGVLAKEKTTTQTIDASNAAGYLGTDWGPSSELMMGVIDDARIYSRALSASEVHGVFNPAPAITSALSSTGTVATALSYQITAANGPTSFNAAGLPAGLSVSAVTGLISGTPTASGTSLVTISAVNASGTDMQTLMLRVYSACDLNRDWATNVADVQLEVNAALGVAACTGDINRDGACNVIDVQRGVNAGLGGQCVVGP